jgi:N-methylhydantoinase A
MLLGLDVGGTFTDAVLLTDRGELHTAKLASTPADPSEGVLAAAHAVLALAGVEPAAVVRFAHGMTVATNALLEGRAARTALIATAGFTDVVELGRQARPDLYRLTLAGPAPLVPPELRFAAPERMTPEGPLRPLEPAAARELVERVAQAEPQAIAVVLLHSYAHPEHERQLGELIGELLPGVHASLSHELVGTFREYERAVTTEVDAALSPLLGSYLSKLTVESVELGLPEPQIMQSSGGLTDAATAAAHAAMTVLSGPAGGAGGALLLAELAGARDVLCFDMGGTSCDVCVIERGRVRETAAREVAGRTLALGMLDIHTVGAGGGSIAWRDAGGALRVGPHSAGAVPGPACYGRGGAQPTVTDANLLLGRLGSQPTLAGDLQLDRDAAAHAIGALARELGLEPWHCAEGIVRVAEAEMLRALRVMTVERGLDPREFVLMPFGGAGPLHAAALARALGIRRVLCPRASGVLCALGLVAAAPRRDVARSVTLSGTSFTAERVTHERELLLSRARAELAEEPAETRVRYELRYRGQSFELTVEQNEAVAPEVLSEAFAQAHTDRYGYRDPEGEVELVTIRVSLAGARPALTLAAADSADPDLPDSPDAADRGQWGPSTGASLKGPLTYPLPESALFIPAGWEGTVDKHGTVHLQDMQIQETQP